MGFDRDGTLLVDSVGSVTCVDCLLYSGSILGGPRVHKLWLDFRIASGLCGDF